jgi:hypothetical protein
MTVFSRSSERLQTCNCDFGSNGTSVPFEQIADRATYRGADKSLARPGRKQATETKDFDVHISCLLS